jgi:hypothetical protein
MRRERKGRRMTSHAEARTPSTEIWVGLRPTHVNENRRAIFEGVDLGGLQCLINGEQGEDRGQSFGEHRFVEPGGPVSKMSSLLAAVLSRARRVVR